MLRLKGDCRTHKKVLYIGSLGVQSFVAYKYLFFKGITMDLITKDSHKINKNQKQGFLTGVMYLSPANESEHQMCFDFTKGCEKLCLGCTSGRMQGEQAKNARVNRTNLLHDDKDAFLEQMDRELKSLIKLKDQSIFSKYFANTSIMETTISAVL